jgi:hypothetical protein
MIAIDLDGALDDYGFDDPSGGTARRLENGQPVRVRLQEIGQALSYLETALESGGCIIYIDEVYAVLEQTKRGGPEAVNAIWTRGRKRNVGGWVSSQRPTWLPLTLISEADWYFCFRLTLEEDRKRMSSFMGQEVMNPITDKHGFFVANAGWETPDYYRKLNTSLKFTPATKTREGVPI